MKKGFLTALIFVSILTSSFAAVYTWTWTGSNGLNYADAGNWSISPAADANTAAMSYPRNLTGNTSVVVFPSAPAGIIELPGVTSFFLAEMRVESGTVSITKSASGGIDVGFDGLGLNISSGARLNVICNAQGIRLLMTATANNFKINGILDLTGSGSSSNPAKLEKQNFISPTCTVGSDGKIIMSGLNASIVSTTNTSLIFLSGSSLDITRNGGTIPSADYRAGSTINVTGATTQAPSFSNSSNTYACDIVWNNPSQSATTFAAQWSLSTSFPTNFTGKFTMTAGYLRFIGGGLANEIFGGFDVQGGTLELGFAGSPNATPTVLNDVNVSGGTFRVSSSDFNGNIDLSVNGNLTQTGGTINIAPGTARGNLIVKGNVNQTSGTITETGGSTSSRLSFGGSDAQNASFSSALSGDALNVEINKSANDVTLSTPLSIPRDLILTARNIILGANTLTVGNLATGGSLASHVVTDGMGALQLLSLGTVSKDFPVGNTINNFDLVNVKNVAGINDFSVKVSNTITPATSPTYFNLPRQWDITAATVPTNGAILLFTPTGVPVATSPLIGHYEMGNWTFINSLTTSPTYSGVFNSFSPFIISSLTPLPVELVTFIAAKTNKSNLLTWKTANEKNNSHFDVERSINGENNWTTIGSVKGNGTSTLANDYSFNDETPLSISYYRLKQMDFDGKSEYSKVVSVIGGKGDKFKITAVLPNPFKDVATVVFDSNKEDNVTVTLMDVTGRVVLLKNVACTEGGNLLNLNTAALSCGIYIVSLRNNESVLTQKIVKN